MQRQLLEMKVNGFYFLLESHILEKLISKLFSPFIDLDKSLIGIMKAVEA